MLHNLWMTPLCFMWCIKISVTGRNGRVCIISPATRARNTRPMHKRFTYLSWPRANWSWNMLWIFHGKIVLSNPPSSTPPSAPPYHTPFRNSYKRRNTSNLDSRLKNWKTIFSVVLSSASRNTRWLNAVEAESKMLSLPFVLLLFRQFSPAIGFNILGICPSASYSHQQPFQALMKALAARGHNVTMISTIPSKVSAIFFFSPLFPFFSPSFPSLSLCISFSVVVSSRRFATTTPLNRSLPTFSILFSLSLSIGFSSLERRNFNSYRVANSFNH